MKYRYYYYGIIFLTYVVIKWVTSEKIGVFPFLQVKYQNYLCCGEH